jgi:hypothetical protein
MEACSKVEIIPGTGLNAKKIAEVRADRVSEWPTEALTLLPVAWRCKGVELGKRALDIYTRLKYSEREQLFGVTVRRRRGPVGSVTLAGL